MAKTLKGPRAAGKTRKSRKRVPRDGDGKPAPQIGSNFKVEPRLARKHFEIIDQRKDAQAKGSAYHRQQIGEAYEAAASELGCDVAAVKHIYGQHAFEKKRQAKEEAMAPEVRNQADQLRLGLGTFSSMPLGRAAIERAEIAEIEREREAKATPKVVAGIEHQETQAAAS